MDEEEDQDEPQKQDESSTSLTRPKGTIYTDMLLDDEHGTRDNPMVSENEGCEDESGDDYDHDHYEGMLGEDNENDDEDASDTDDDSDSGDELRVALAIDPTQLSTGDGPPHNGHDYLRQVQEERAKYPPVASAERPPPPVPRLSPQVARLAQLVSANQPACGSASTRIPTPESFKTDVLNNFTKLREAIEEERERHCGSAGIGSEITRRPRDNGASELLSSLDESPHLSDIIHKEQSELHQALEKLAEIGEQRGLVPNLAAWMYSLIAALREPIEPDIYSTLRRLARICMRYEAGVDSRTGQAKRQDDYCYNDEPTTGRKKQGDAGCEKQDNKQRSSEELRASSLLITCIVRHYFGQTDLK